MSADNALAAAGVVLIIGGFIAGTAVPALRLLPWPWAGFFLFGVFPGSLLGGLFLIMVSDSRAQRRAEQGESA